jgi:NAD(P)-dependent dehydrogenase (short-subunit alcohol dehydrogenase family)
MLAALAALFTAGVPVRWDTFRSPSARFVRLPAYPWQRERYWSESEESTADRLGVTPHPLLGYRVSAARPTWELDVSTTVLKYLNDHAIRGAVVFPGAAYVEMALAAAREVFGAADVAVEEIRFERALFLQDGERPKAQITVDAELGMFEIHSRTEKGNWVRNAAGRLTQPPPVAMPNVDVRAVETRCAEPLDAELCYAQFAAQGFHYGPEFQKIARIAISDGEALAWFDNLDVSEPEYQLHPTVLDACFQALVATDPFRNPDGGPSKTYLPVGIDRITLSRRPSGSMLAWAYLERQDQSGARGNIYLCDSDGAVAVAIEGFEVKALDRVEGALSQEQMQRSVYDVRWVDAPPEGAVSEPALAGERWLLFADVTGIADELTRKIEAAGAEVVVVTRGSEYSCNAGAFCVNPAVPEHFTRLLADASRSSANQLTAVVHMWNLDLGHGIPGDAQDVERAGQRGSVSVVHLVQALTLGGASPRLWLVTRGAQQVDETDPVAVMQSPVWGLGRVIGHQEHIGMWGGLIDLDPSAPADEASLLLQEIVGRSDEDQIAFRRGQRFAARFGHSTDLKPSLPLRLRPDASYLVTGAFGALGLLTARWMVKQGARKLVLMARSTVPERTRWKEPGLPANLAGRIAALRELEAMGASVMVASVDVGDEVQLKRFLQQFDDTGWPAIRGVIHSAGLVQDQLLLHMDAESFQKVLRPKVHGAWNLHRVFAGTALDFFVLYSSIGSIVAATGQANYASGNAFLDALAHHRQHQGLPAISINWGPWAVGMVTDLNLTEHYATRGLDVITPEQGMRFLGFLMGQRRSQAAVLSADWRKLFEFQPKVCSMLAHLTAESDTEAGTGSGAGAEDFLEVLLMADPAEQRPLLEEHVQMLASRVLRMEQQKVCPTEPLTAFGLDSMMATELKNRLELSVRVPVSVLDLLKGVSIAEFAASLLPRLVEENADIQQLLEELEGTRKPEPPSEAALSPAALPVM